MIGVKPNRQPAPPTVQADVVPSPTRGVDARSPLGKMSLDNCVYSFNLMPAETGMLVRNGFAEWQIDIESVASSGCRTLIVFGGLTEDKSDDKLFAATDEGIWDVTVEGAAPVLKVAFVSTANDAGHGVFTHYTDQAGAIFILYADFENGLYIYTQSTDTWAVANPANYTGGIVTTDVVFVVVHKQRLWLIEKNAAQAYYLPVASMQGAGTKFYFGTKFPHGGSLAALIDWSVDGGIGVDDYLIAVSTTGDVIPYQGADPSVAEGAGLAGWGSRGTYFVGKVPVGRKFFSEYAGEMYVLSSFGLISMSDLLRGVDVKDIAKNSMAFPIANVLRNALRLTSNELGWQPLFLPSQGQLVITAPQVAISGNYIQYNMNLATEGWGFWRGVPITCIAEWEGVTYFGSSTSKVYSMDASRDYVLLDTAANLAEGSRIEYSILTAFSTGNEPGSYKIAQIVRPDFVAATLPTYQVKVVYDYDTREMSAPVLNDNTQGWGNWDVALWDVNTWHGELHGFSGVSGVNGMGRAMAIAMRGESSDPTRLISWDIMWTTGGML